MTTADGSLPILNDDEAALEEQAPGISGSADSPDDGVAARAATVFAALGAVYRLYGHRARESGGAGDAPAPTVWDAHLDAARQARERAEQGDPLGLLLCDPAALEPSVLRVVEATGDDMTPTAAQAITESVTGAGSGQVLALAPDESTIDELLDAVLGRLPAGASDESADGSGPGPGPDADADADADPGPGPAARPLVVRITPGTAEQGT